MRHYKLTASASLIVGILAGASAVILAQATMKPGHDRVPPYREPSPYVSQADIQTALNQLDPKLLSSRTGGAIEFAKGKAVGVVRRRMRGPQYAITHPRTVEYIIVTKGTATLVTGGTLIPPTIDSDPYPNPNPNATIRSEVGVNGGLARKIGPGDVVVNLPGTPHWLSAIDDVVEYVEIAVPERRSGAWHRAGGGPASPCCRQVGPEFLSSAPEGTAQLQLTRESPRGLSRTEKDRSYCCSATPLPGAIRYFSPVARLP